MNTQSKLITEYVIIKDFPETKSVGQRENGGEAYKFDVLKGVQIPSNPNASRQSIKEMEFKFSPNSNTPGIQKSAIEVTKMIAQQHARLLKGEIYAKVSLFMSGRKNKGGVVDTYTPYINNVEFIETDDTTRPYIEAALRGDEAPNF